MTSPYKHIRTITDQSTAIKRCDSCGEDFVVVTTNAAEARVSCLECEACFSIYWYDHEIDPLWLSLGKKELHPAKIKKEVEALIPPCQKCEGKLSHIDWYSYGAPIHCPHCRSEQTKMLSNNAELSKVRGEVGWLKHVDAAQ